MNTHREIKSVLTLLIVIILSFSVSGKIFAGDGTYRIFQPGSINSSICFMEATAKGHSSEVIEGPVQVIVIELNKGDFEFTTH